MTEGSEGRIEVTAGSERAYTERLVARGQRFPYSGQWELTCRCNLTCAMCYTHPLDTPDRIKEELRYEEVVRILDELQEAGSLELRFTGGEPFARPDFLDIYSPVHQRLWTDQRLWTARALLEQPAAGL